MLTLSIDVVYTFVYHRKRGSVVMKTTSSVKKWGNSLAVRIPAAVAQDLGLAENSSIQIVSNGSVATIQPQKHKKVSLDKLVAAITPDNLHEEVNWGRPVGKEIW